MKRLCRRMFHRAWPATLSLILLHLFPSPPARAVTFQPYASYSTATNPLRVVAAGFGGARADLAVIGEGSDAVSLFRNKGDGTFGPKVDYGTGTAPRALVTADFNGDGKADLATANHGDNTVSVLLGNGDGTFGTKTDFSGVTSPVGLVAADFTGDGTIDLVVVNGGGGNAIVFFSGNGDGTFAAVSGQPLGFVPKSAIAADFDGDGKKDLALVDNAGDAVAIYRGDGTGGFSLAGTFGTGSEPGEMVAGDFNGDGKIDLAVVNGGIGANSVSVLLGNGDGTFQAKREDATGTLPRSVAAGDFNGDGKTDLVTANNQDNSFSLLLGNGDGTFQPKSDRGTGSNPLFAASGDLNGDGKTDLVTVDYGAARIAVFLNASVPAVSVSPAPFTFGNVQYNGGTASRDFTIANSGEAVLGIGAIELTGQDTAMYGLAPGGTTPCPPLPTTLPAGGSCTVTVTFTPTSAGLKSVSLSVASDAPASPATVAISGTGTDYTLALTINGTGGGSVRVQSFSSALTCSASCAPSFDNGTTLQLLPAPSPDSIVGWTGCTDLNSCVLHGRGAWISLYGDKSLTLTFTHVDPVRMSGGISGDYTSLQTAYNAAADLTVIRSRSVTLNENLIFGSNISVDWQGGYDGDATGYDAVFGVTSLSGSLSIAGGTVNVAGLVISP